MHKNISIITWASLVAACVEPTSIVVEPLRVINWSPASGAYCVNPAATIAATFSDALVATSVRDDTFVLRDGDTPVDAALDYEEGSFTVHLTPAAPLAFSHTYTATATAELEGRTSGRLAIEISASFVTISRTGCVPQVECNPPECCTLPSDCPGTLICVDRTCVQECATDRDCFRGTCGPGGVCIPDATVDGGGGDPGPGDPGPGDPTPGDA